MLTIEYSFSHNLLISQLPECILFASAHLLHVEVMSISELLKRAVSCWSVVRAPVATLSWLPYIVAVVAPTCRICFLRIIY